MGIKTPFLVGLVLLLGAGAMTWFALTTSESTLSARASYVLYADFIDASGIRSKTRVQTSGIDIGKIEDIAHARNKEGRLVARITLRVSKDIPVYGDAALRKVAESLLGDFRLDLDPGTNQFPQLKDGDLIPNVQSYSDIEIIQSELREVSRNVNRISQALANTLSGPEGEGSLKIIMQRIEKAATSIQAASDVIADLAVTHKEDVATLLSNLAQTSKNLNTISGSLKSYISGGGGGGGRGEGSEELVTGTRQASGSGQPSIRDSLVQLNETLTRLNAVAKKIDDGQGTVGKVINDPGIADKVERTLDDINQITGPLGRIVTEVELRTEYDVPFTRGNKNEEVNPLEPGIKNVLGLRIFPKPDKYYMFELVSDPRGVEKRTVNSTTYFTRSKSNCDPGDTACDLVENGQVVEKKDVISFNNLKFSAQFAKRYGNITLRLGIMENTGGLGANWHALRDHLELRLDIFDFDRRDIRKNENINPRFRGAAAYELFNHVYMHGGIDDPFNSIGRTWFLGAMLRFTDEDLKSLLLIAPTP